MCRSIVSKICLAAQGIALDRSTRRYGWSDAWWLKPLHRLLLETALSYPRLFADEMLYPMLDPVKAEPKLASFGGPWPRAIAPGEGRLLRTVVTPSSRIARASERRKRYSRAFPAFFKWTANAGQQSPRRSWPRGRAVTFAFCFARCTTKNLRRPCRDEIADCGAGVVAHRRLLRNRNRIRGKSAFERRAVRLAETKPLIDDFKIWLEARLAELSKKSGLAKATATRCRIGPDRRAFSTTDASR